MKGTGVEFKQFIGRAKRGDDPEVKQCPECLSEIPHGARRCPHCTSQLSADPV